MTWLLYLCYDLSIQGAKGELTDVTLYIHTPTSPGWAAELGWGLQTHSILSEIKTQSATYTAEIPPAEKIKMIVQFGVKASIPTLLLQGNH